MSVAIGVNLMDINKIISIVRNLKEDGVISGITNSVGNGGFTNAATPPGLRDGYDKVMGLTRRIGKGKFPGARARWKNTNNSN